MNRDGLSNNGGSPTNGSGNGSRTEAPVPHFTQTDTGTTFDTGHVVGSLNAVRGGRLESWQWRTIPPPVALNPATRNDPPRLLSLVDGDGALIDHFLPLGSRPEEISSGSLREFGDFVEEPYNRQVAELGGEWQSVFIRDGSISAGKRAAEVRVVKSIGVRPGASDLSVLYRVINSSARPLQILFAVEFNLFAPGLAEASEGVEDAYYLVDGDRPSPDSLDATGVSGAVTSVTLANPASEVALQLGWDRECDLWRIPAVSGTAGAARLMAVWRLSLPARDNWALGLWLAPV